MVIPLLVEFSLDYYLATYKFLHLKCHWSKLPSLPTTFDCISGVKLDIDWLARTNYPIASVPISPLAKLELVKFLRKLIDSLVC